MSHPARVALVVACAVTVLAAPAAPAQSAAVIDGHDVAVVLGATAGAAILSHWDVPIARVMRDSALHARHPGFATAARRASLATETAYMLGGGAVYLLARARHDDGTADVAFHTTESVASAALVIQVVRGALGRARPYVVDDSGATRGGNPYDFEPLHGFTSFNYRSFPSMHAMASFAVATALSQEMRVRETPNRRIISPLLYVAAAAPAAARMYLDEHWASDIGMGIVLGVLAGQKVVQYSHAHPDNRIDRQFLHPRIVATVSRGAGGTTFTLLPF
jgi:membrane-associated phospholipid phosphatase